MYKKDFPVKILEALQPLQNKTSPYYKRQNKTNTLLSFKDNDEKSKFFFDILKYTPSNSTFIFEVAYAPSTISDTNIMSTRVEMSSLEAFLDSWVKLLKRYEPLKAPNDYEDPITCQSENEFYDEFELVDEDADTTAFSTEKQIAIDACLDYIIKQLDEVKNEQNQAEVDEVIAECIDLKQNQTKLSKKAVVKKFSKIFAKAKKGGIYLLKIVRDEIVKEFAKQLVNGAADNIHLIGKILP